MPPLRCSASATQPASFMQPALGGWAGRRVVEDRRGSAEKRGPRQKASGDGRALVCVSPPTHPPCMPPLHHSAPQPCPMHLSCLAFLTASPRPLVRVLSFLCSLEYLTPLVPQHFLLLASLANVGKSIGGWSGVRVGVHTHGRAGRRQRQASTLLATRAPLLLHPSPHNPIPPRTPGLTTFIATQPAFHRSFCLRENMADISAKTQAQQMVMDNLGARAARGVSAGPRAPPCRRAQALLPSVSTATQPGMRAHTGSLPHLLPFPPPSLAAAVQAWPPQWGSPTSAATPVGGGSGAEERRCNAAQQLASRALCPEPRA